MPELPEVETIVRELRNKISGEIFSEFDPVWPGSFVSDYDSPLLKTQIVDIRRKGKFILFHLNDGYLLTHLRMTGQLIVSNSLPDNKQHLRLIFQFESGKFLLFYDLRKFGRVYHTSQPDKVLQNTGIDALSADLDVNNFLTMVKGKNTRVKSFFLNQKYIAGFGNIYIDESLFRARIHPQTKFSDLSTIKIRTLYSESRKVLLEAIDRMGSTILDYKTTGGGFGSNQNYFQVYQRQGLPCVLCQTIIVKAIIGGRGTHYCPKCQKQMKN
jgi:formamidopyrimidine-DNA glycosylase